MSSLSVAPPAPRRLNEALERNIDALHARRAAEEAASSVQDKLAGAITAFTGSMLFVYLHVLIYATWIAVNAKLIPGVRPFDPSFVMLSSEASVEAIFLSTFVLISQNRMQRAADKRADLDLHINLLAEHELTKLAAVVTAIARKMDVPVPGDMDEVERDVAAEAVLDELERAQRRNDDAR